MASCHDSMFREFLSHSGGAFRILVNVQHAHTPEALFKFPHQRDVDVLLKSPSFRLPLAGSSSGLDF